MTLVLLTKYFYSNYIQTISGWLRACPVCFRINKYINKQEWTLKIFENL